MQKRGKQMGIKKFIKNMSFLYKVSIKKEYDYIENFSYILDGIISEIQSFEKPYIYDIDTTLDILYEQKMSIARFGDGEFSLIEGCDIPFQQSSKELSSRLIDVLSSKNSKICIAIPLSLYEVPKKTYNWHFWRAVGSRFRMLLKNYIHPECCYYPAEITLLTSHLTETQYIDDYFKKIRKIWHNKDIHIIHGEGIFDNFEFDIFDNARSVHHQIAPSKNAFEKYDSILNDALKVDKNKLIIAILGPTATILAYDLALNGYQALDLGHIAKSYDWYKKGKILFQTIYFQ